MTDDHWIGTAQLLDEAGTVFDTVRVSLFKRSDRTWNGVVKKTTFEGGPWEHIVKIRLGGDDGPEADVRLTDRTKRLTDGSGEIRDAYIEGKGPAPF